MSNEKTTGSGGVGIGGLLFVAFTVLKLTGVINWSWWLVTAPLWGGIAVVLLVVVAALAVKFILKATATKEINK